MSTLPFVVTVEPDHASGWSEEVMLTFANAFFRTVEANPGALMRKKGGTLGAAVQFVLTFTADQDMSLTTCAHLASYHMDQEGLTGMLGVTYQHLADPPLGSVVMVMGAVTEAGFTLDRLTRAEAQARAAQTPKDAPNP